MDVHGGNVPLRCGCGSLGARIVLSVDPVIDREGMASTHIPGELPAEVGIWSSCTLRAADAVCNACGQRAALI